MDNHVDVVVARPEQFMGLDHLEPLVHEGRGVDGDLGAHGPRRMGQRLFHGHGGQLFGRPAPERTPGRCEDDARHPFVHVVGPQALMDGAVLAIDWQQFGAGGGPHSLDNRTGGDQGLLVGQAEAAAGSQRGQGHREPREPDHAVDGHVG